MKPDGARGVAVVGGGAAGMVAAIAAARAGAAVTVFERMPRVGRKLLATGNGRCNLANSRLDIGRYHGADPLFARPVLERFGVGAALDFFGGLGVEPREEGGGKIFPRSGQASAVLDLLRHEMARLGVEVRCDAEVTRLALGGGAWRVAAGDRSCAARAVVVAAGGRAAPQLGSNGSGYGLVLPLGHRLVEPFPALTRIRARSPWLRHLKGVKVDGEAVLRAGPREVRRAAGEILFTETGLSGPPILDLSRAAGELARGGRRPSLAVDLCPELTRERLAAALRERFSRAGATAELALVGFLNKRLVPAVLRDAGIADPAAAAASVTGDRLGALALLLKGWRFEVTGTDSWREAQVTAGGIDTAGVEPATLASRSAPGLFFAGEVLDVDGDCGGYNLQWAWSSGFVAGTEAARRA